MARQAGRGRRSRVRRRSVVTRAACRTSGRWRPNAAGPRRRFRKVGMDGGSGGTVGLTVVGARPRVARTVCSASHERAVTVGRIPAQPRSNTVAPPAYTRGGCLLKLTCTEPPTGIVGTAQVMVDPTMVRPDGSGVTTVANGSTFDRSSVAVAPDTGAPLSCGSDQRVRDRRAGIDHRARRRVGQLRQLPHAGGRRVGDRARRGLALDQGDGPGDGRAALARPRPRGVAGRTRTHRACRCRPGPAALVTAAEPVAPLIGGRTGSAERPVGRCAGAAGRAVVHHLDQGERWARSAVLVIGRSRRRRWAP